MSKRLKRILSVTLAVVVCFGVGLIFKFGLHSKAAYIDPGTYGDFEYKQMPYRDWYDAENRIEITKYNGNESVVTIPDTIEGITVRSIGENAFRSNSTITKIVFPDTLQEINVGAFMDCTNLSNVHLPKSLYRLHGNAFANCEKLTSITIPSVSGRYNGNSYDEFQMLGVNIKDEDGKYVYTDYGDIKVYSAFEGCNNLKTVLFEEGVRVIPTYLFQNCMAITSLAIPNSVEKIYTGAFRNCINLESVVFENDSNLKELRGFEECPKLRTISVPDTVDTIGGLARTSIDSITLPDSLTIIEASTFKDCVDLEELLLPDSVIRIGDRAFSGCNGIKELSLPKQLEYIGAKCFEGTEITAINLPKSLKSTGDSNIGGPFAGSIIKDIEFEEGFERIPSYCFKDSIIESIDLPDTLKSIGAQAFYNCPHIKEITIPKSCDDIHFYNRSDYNAPGALSHISKVYGYKGTGADTYCANNPESDFYPLDKPEYITGSFCVQDTGKFRKEDNKGFHYSDSYFYKPSSEYNPSLATMSLSLAFSTYGKKMELDNPKSKPDYEHYDQYVKKLLEDCGFTYYIPDDYDYNQKPTKNGIGTAIASKKLPGGYTVIAVAVRGGGYESEWSSNFNMGWPSVTREHYGFYNSANIVCGRVRKCIKDLGLDDRYGIKRSKVIIWITGFSRGAAVATQAAKKLNTSSSDYRIPAKRIFAYGFATPAGAYGANIDNEDYIFNVIDYNDPVPLVAPKEFGFDRYGTTMLLPYKESASKSVYNNYIKEVKRRMGKNAIDFRLKNDITTASMDVILPGSFGSLGFKFLYNLFRYESIGSFSRKAFHYISETLESRDNYVRVFQNNLMTAMDKMDGDILNEYGNLGKALNELLSVLKNLAPDFAKNHFYTATEIVLNADKLFAVHASPEHYLTWMQLMDPNYPNSLPVKWGDPNYRAFSIVGMADILVYNADNVLVASIIDGNINESEDLGICVSKDENGSTVVYLPPSEDYNVQIAAKDNGKVTYSVDEYVAASGTKTRNVAYSSVPVSKGETLIGTVTAYSSEELENGTTEASSAEYGLQKNEEPLEASHDFTANEIKTHQYNVVTEEVENGILFGGGSFTVGTVAQVAAVPDIGFQIDKFYLNGEEIVDDNLDEDDSTINFEVNGNSTVSATFKKAPGLFSSKGTELTSKSSTTLFYNDLDEDALNHTYKFIVHNKTTNQWYKLRDFDAESSIEWFTGVPGEKSLYVDIKDITTDTIVKRVELNVTVSDPAFNIDSFTISPDTTVVPNMSATLEANVSGGTGEYLYKFIVYNQSTKQWYKLRDFAPENTFDWFTGPEGEKTLYVDVKDASNDTIVKRAELNVSVSDPKLKVESFTIEPEGELATNTRALLQAKAIGGAGDYQYKFIVYNEATKQWYKLKDFGPESTYDWYTGPAGNKTLYVDVRDTEGTVVRKGLTVKVNE